MKRLCFCCDANADLGFGHLARCLTLATEARRQGSDAVFLLRRGDTLAHDQVLSRGFAVFAFEQRADWPAYMIVFDLAHRQGMARPEEYDALLSDMREKGRETAWIDSMGKDAAAQCLREHCDVVISPYLGAELGVRPRCERWLAGAEYAVLPPQFALPESGRRPGGFRRLLVSMGGSDPWGFSEKVLDILADQRRVGWRVRTICGPFFEEARREALTRAFPWAEVVPSTSDISTHYRESDAVVTAAGLTRYEIAALGLPGLLISPTDAYREYLMRFEEMGIARVVFSSDPNFTETLSAALRNLLLVRRTVSCSRPIDGRGTRRVVSALLGSAS